MGPHNLRRKVGLVTLVLLLLVLGGGAILYFGKLRGGDGDLFSDGDEWFADVTDEVGVDFVHDVGDVTKWHMPQIHGSGVAVFDFDGDGRLDLYFLNFGGPGSKAINRLYKNLGDGTFKDVTEGSGLGISGHNTGVIIGDVNNDGWPDVVVTQWGGVKLLLNNGNGTFEDVTKEAGIDEKGQPAPLLNPQWGTSANFVDYDRDGYLDLVIVNFVEFNPQLECTNRTSKKDYCGPSIFAGQVTQLFRNLGPRGKGRVSFENVTVKAGLAKAPAPGLGAFCADFNGDRWPDIFVANDGKPNHLWINQKDGTFFKEEALIRGIAVDSIGQAQAGMGIAVGDTAGSGLFDVYVTHLASERNTLWQQGPKRGQFTDRTASAGLLRTDWRGTGFGTVMGDFDNDGWLDIGVVNGAVARGTPTLNPALGEHFQEFGERNQLFRNLGKGKFSDISRRNRPFCGTPNVGRGLAAGDLNGDGALDLVVTTVGNRAHIFRNVARSRGHWLLVRALDPRLKRDAYGAEVVVVAGGRRLLRIINPGDSYQCSSDPRAHFGLGEAARFDAIHVLWPDGLAEVFPGGEADRPLTLRRGEGKKEEHRQGP